MGVDAASANTPDPLSERPPQSRFCDLVLNGGVASGVAYPWALLHLARRYRFKSIGGNSVGAMAAALAAAAEYGRCNGFEDSFEVLRRLPLKLAEPMSGGRTKMLSLFQPTASVRRLFDLFVAAVSMPDDAPSMRHLLNELLKVYGFWWLMAPLTLLLGVPLVRSLKSPWNLFSWDLLWGLLLLVGAALLGGGVVLWRLYRDLKAMTKNDYGLCTGRGQVPGEEGLVEWLHQGIQRSAGRDRDDPPLTFADLWAAPRFGQLGPEPQPGGVQPDNPGIELQLFTSNITHGRPVRLPLERTGSLLYFDPDEWAHHFPPSVLNPLKEVSRPYCPTSPSDPDPHGVNTSAEQKTLMSRLRELPSGHMPIVVAARLSLCFPVLFSFVPVYAVDYEDPRGKRVLRKCLLSDGGLCTNFPIHLFDAAHPTRPTFGFLFDRRRPSYPNQSVWLPPYHLDGRGDNWNRDVPGAEDETTGQRSLFSQLLGLAGGLIVTAKDWNDLVSNRLPQVRNRVLRMALRPGEGQLNIAMPSSTILSMAHEYGTGAGVELVKRFAPGTDGQATPSWREHLYVRALIELRALHRHLNGYSAGVNAVGHTVTLRQLLEEAALSRPLPEKPEHSEPTGGKLSSEQCQSLLDAVKAVEALEAELSGLPAQMGPYQPVPEPQFRLRPPL